MCVRVCLWYVFMYSVLWSDILPASETHGRRQNPLPRPWASTDSCQGIAQLPVSPSHQKRIELSWSKIMWEGFVQMSFVYDSIHLVLCIPPTGCRCGWTCMLTPLNVVFNVSLPLIVSIDLCKGLLAFGCYNFGSL